MLHLDSSHKLPDLKSSQASTNPNPEQKGEIKKKPKLVVVDDYKKLTFEKFLYTDMTKFDARIASVEDNVFSATVYY